MRGSIFKRCGCTEVIDGTRRQLGQQCPRLRRSDGTWSPRHGTWSFATSTRGPGGKRRQVVRGGFPTAADAQRALDATRDKISRGVVPNDRLTVGEYLGEWLKAKSDVRRSTVRGYEQHISKHLAPNLGHVRLGELRVAHVAEALALVTSSDANRQRVRSTLRSALNDAVRQGLIVANPASMVKSPAGKRARALVWSPERVERWQVTGQQPSPVMVWTPAQLGEFLDAASDHRLYGMWHLISHRGLRRGEACGVGWSDVDLDGGRLTERRQLVQLGWAVYEDSPKSDAGSRRLHSTPAPWPCCAPTVASSSPIGCAGVLPGWTRARCSSRQTGRSCTRRRSLSLQQVGHRGEAAADPAA